jgi:enamine deaminase RidA (YjgF/YER057c/UK114 family)
MTCLVSTLAPARRSLKFYDCFYAVRIAAKIGSLASPRNRDPVAAPRVPPCLQEVPQSAKTTQSARNYAQFVEDQMAGTVEKKLQELGIALATPPAPIANYVPFVRSGNMLTISGQICLGADGKLVAKGQLGGGVSIEDGQKAARACALNVLAQVKAALGDLDKVTRVIRLGGFINSVAGYPDGPKVMNGASDVMVAVFGDKGKHARSTVGVSALPADAAVEVEGLFEVS